MSALVQVSRESREQPETQQAQMFAALLRSFTVMKLMRCLKGKQRRKRFVGQSFRWECWTDLERLLFMKAIRAFIRVYCSTLNAFQRKMYSQCQNTFRIPKRTSNCMKVCLTGRNPLLLKALLFPKSHFYWRKLKSPAGSTAATKQSARCFL